MRRSLIVFIAAVLAFVSALIWFASVAPAKVPAHYNLSGEVDLWDSRTGFLASIGGGGFAVIAIFAGLAVLLPRLPAKWINVPSRRGHDYWTSPKHRPELNRIMATSMDFVGGAVALLFTSIVVNVGLDARGTSMPGWVFVAVLVAMLCTIFGTVVYIFMRTRAPHGQGPGTPGQRRPRRGSAK